MKNYELAVECRITCAVQVEANNEEEAIQKVEELSSNDLFQWASDEETEIIDVFELEQEKQ